MLTRLVFTEMQCFHFSWIPFQTTKTTIQPSEEKYPWITFAAKRAENPNSTVRVRQNINQGSHNNDVSKQEVWNKPRCSRAQKTLSNIYSTQSEGLNTRGMCCGTKVGPGPKEGVESEWANLIKGKKNSFWKWLYHLSPHVTGSLWVHPWSSWGRKGLGFSDSRMMCDYMGALYHKQTVHSCSNSERSPWFMNAWGTTAHQSR